ncbi:hypothetical protein C0Q70_17910 [Pomacea canaliculata]|uniref:Uncharacterized protein n=1 Tax=Pomacea canaliculata TaxID=400727 RepID=A0A2T7NLS2_POMCA|nr:hypothetical protein C0Q70_17910 [Pomacea canaliculata]
MDWESSSCCEYTETKVAAVKKKSNAGVIRKQKKFLSVTLKGSDINARAAAARLDELRRRQRRLRGHTRPLDGHVLGVSGGDGEDRLNYTLVFWRRNDSLSPPSRQEASNVLAPLADGHVSCVLLQRKHSKSPVLEGLLPRTRYTVCVENGFLDSCYLSSIAEMRSASLSSSSSLSSFSLFSSWPSNCVTIFTPGANTPRVPATPSTMVTAVATVSVFVLVILIIVFTVFLVRRQSETFRSCVDTVFCDTLCCCCPETCVHSNEMPARSYMEELTSPPAGRARRFLGETPRRGRTPRRTLLGKLLGRKSAAEDSRAAAALLVLPTSSESGLPGIESSLGDIEILPAETDPALQDPMAADLFLLQATFVPPAARPKRGHRSGRRKRGHGRRKEQVARLTPVLEAPSETEMTSSEQASPDDANT